MIFTNIILTSFLASRNVLSGIPVERLKKERMEQTCNAGGVEMVVMCSAVTTVPMSSARNASPSIWGKRSSNELNLQVR